MTLGPAIAFLGLWKKEPGSLAKPFIIFGRVPLFYYVLHLFLLHTMAAVYSYARFGTAAWLFTAPATPDVMGGTPPKGYGFDLPMVYVFWIVAVLILYPLCKWFARYKQTHKQAWLSYV
jgi:hypothetical protein